MYEKRIGRFRVSTFNSGGCTLELEYNSSQSVLFHLLPDDIHDLKYAVECILREAGSATAPTGESDAG